MKIKKNRYRTICGTGSLMVYGTSLPEYDDLLGRNPDQTLREFKEMVSAQSRKGVTGHVRDWIFPNTGTEHAQKNTSPHIHTQYIS